MYTDQQEILCPRIGDVYTMYFNGTGSEQSGWRPGVVFQNNKGNANSPNLIALPMTSSLKKLNMPTHILVSAQDAGLKKDSIVLCENPEKMSKDKLGRFITHLSDEYMKKIAVGNLVASSAISFLDQEALLEVWSLAKKLNNAA